METVRGLEFWFCLVVMVAMTDSKERVARPWGENTTGKGARNRMVLYREDLFDDRGWLWMSFIFKSVQ